MQENPATIAADATIDQALAVLLERDTGELFVTDVKRRLLGVVPDYALLKARLNGMQPQTGVDKVMSCNLATAQPDQDVDDVAAAFRDGRYWQLPVVERGCLLGSIARRDVLRALSQPAGANGNGDHAETSPAGGRLPRFLQARSRSAGELQSQGAGHN